MLICLLIVTCQRLDAATLTWTGGGGDGNWGTSANWGGATPAANDSLVFAGTTNLTTTNNLAADTSFASIAFSANAGAFILGGNRITLAGDLTNGSASTQTVNLAMILSGTRTIACTTNPVVLGGVLSGTGALVINGASSVSMSVNNTYSGGTTISQGTVNAGGTGLGTGLVTVAAGATLSVSGGTGLSGRYFNTAAVTTNFASLTALQTHVATQALALVTVPSTLNFGTTGSGFPSPYTSGATNFEAYYSGKLTIGTAGVYTFNTTSDDGSVLWVDGTLVVNSNSYHSLATVTGTITLGTGQHDLVVGFYQGTGGYGLNAQISGAGNTTMVDISTANATLSPAHLEVYSLAGAGTVALASGGLVVGRDNTSTEFSGVISGNGGGGSGNGLAKLGTGTLILSGNNTYSGSTRITAGTLQIGNGGTSGTLGTGTVLDNATLTYARSDTMTVANVINGTGAVVMNGTGTVIQCADNTYTGTTTITQGTIDAGGSGLGSGAVTVAAAGTLAVTGGSGLAARYFNVAPSSTNFAALTTLQAHLGSQTLALADTATTMNMGNTGASFPSPYNSGGSNFEALYSGRLTIGTAGVYTFNTSSDDGTMLWIDGVLVVSNNGTHGIVTATGTATLATGAHSLVLGYFQGTGGYGLNVQISGAGNTTMSDLSTANATLTPDLVVGSLAGAGTVLLTNGSLVTGFNGTSTTFSGTISGGGGLLKRGAGTLTLTGASSYTDATTVSNGTLKLGSGASLGNTAIAVCSGATIAPMPGSGTIALGTTGAGSAGATLTLLSGAIYDMTDAAVGACALQQNASFAGTALSTAGATMNFEIGSGGVDTLATTSAGSTSGTTSIGLTVVGSSLTLAGSYQLISAASGLGGGTWQFTGGGTQQHVSAGANSYVLTLSSSATAVTVTVNDGVEIWNGTTSTDWNDASNWSLGLVPNANYDVQIGNGTGAFKATPSLTAGGGVCRSITFASAASTIGAGGGTLTIGAGGITASVSGSAIACPVTLGASQTWNTGSGTLAVSGAIGGSFALTKSGSGTLTLSAANAYTGPTTITGGTVASGIDNALPTGSALILGASDGTGSGALDLSTFSQTLASLTSQSNSTTANTVTITSGKTLTISGAGGLSVGIDLSASASSTSKLTMAGGGSLVVANAAANVVVGLAQASASFTNTATLDLTALASATLGSGGTAINELRLGYGQTAGGSLYLSNTANTITATTVRVGDSAASNPGTGILMQLGTGTNSIAADTIEIGFAKATGTIAFASQAASSPGTVTITGKSGATANLVIGSKGGINTAFNPTGLLDLRGHVATIAAGTVTIGLANDTGTGSASGTISMDGGTFTAATVAMGAKSSSGTGSAQGAINLGGGSFTVNASGSCTLGSQSGSGSASGTISITGGTFTANADLIDGGGSATTTITLNGGTLDMKGFKIGGATAIDALNLQSGTLQNVLEINNGGSFAKTTSGTLTLAGTNSCTGAMTVSAGTLLVTGTTAAGSAVTVASGATLAGTGTVGGAITVANGGTLAPGTGGTTIGTLTTGAVTFNATSIHAVDLDGTGPTCDLVGSSGTVTCAGTLTVASAANAAAGKVYTLISGAAVGGAFSGAGQGSTFVAQGRTFQIFYRATAVTLTDVTGVAGATRTWTGGGGDDNWSTAANWGGTAPLPGDSLVFAGSTRLTPNDDFAAGTSFASIAFNAGSGNFTIGGNALALSGGATALASNATSGTMTVNNALTFSTAAPTITSTSGGTLAIGGTIANGGFALTVAAGGTTSSSAAISGTGALAKSGTGTLTLSGTNTYSGGTSVNAGILSVSADAHLGAVPGSATPGSITLNGGTLRFTGTATLTLNANRGIALGNAGGTIAITIPATTFGGANDGVVYGGIIADASGQSGALTVSGVGMLALSGSSTYSGTTTVDTGWLSGPTSGGPYTNILPTTTVVNLVNGGRFNYCSNQTQTIAGLTGDATGLLGSTNQTTNVTLTVNVAGSSTFPGVIGRLVHPGKTGNDSIFALAKTGAGTLTLSGANTYTNATTVSAGVLSFGNNTKVSSTAVSIASGAVLEYNDAGAVTQPTLTLSGAGTVRKTGAGTLAFGSQGNVTWNLSAGALIDVQQGTLVGGSTIQDFWTGNLSSLNIASGATFKGVEANVRIDALTGSGTFTTGYANAGYVTATIGVNNGSGTFSGVIQDDSSAGTLTKIGTGTQILSGANTYSGGTIISAGVLKLGASGTLPSSGWVVANGTLDLAGYAQTVGSLLGTGVVDCTAAGSPTLTVGQGNANGCFSGIVRNTAGTVALTKTGSGTQVLLGSSTYGGATVIAGGTLSLGTLPVTANLLYQLDASSSGNYALSAGKVTSWTDLSGHGNHFTGASGPTVTAAAFNGLDVLTFGSAQTLSLNASTSPLTVFIVNSVSSYAFLDGIFGQDNSDQGIRLSSATSWSNPGNVNDYTNGSGGAMYVNGVSGSTFTANTPHLLDAYKGGSISVPWSVTTLDNYFSGRTRPWTGSIGEVEAYDTALGAADHQAVEYYLMGKWLTGTAGAPRLPIGTALQIAAGATLELGGLSSTIGSLAGNGGGAGAVTNNGSTAATLTVGDATSTTFAGVIQNGTHATALTKAGPGTLTLGGACTYTGATTIAAGTLLVTGSTAAGSAVAVGNGTTLAGTGTVGGTITMASGGTLAPGTGGTAIATLATGAITCNAGSIYAVDLDGAGPAGDRISSSGTVVCGGTLTIASLANAAIGKTYPIVNAGTVSGTFSGLANNAVFIQAGRLFRIAYAATSVTLTDCVPVLTGRQTLDTDGNGRIDRIRLTFDLPLNDDTSGLTVTVAGYTVTGYSTGTANDAVLDVLLAESGAGDTGATPAVRIVANTSLAYASGTGLVQAEGSGTAATDAAAPVLLSSSWTDGGAGGVSSGDTLTLTFSESVTTASMTVGDLGLPVTGDTLSSTAIADQTGSTISMTLAGSPRLTPGGAYSAAATAAGKPSGVYLASGAHVHDAVALAGAVGNAAGAVDVGPASTTVAIAWSAGGDPKTWALGTLTVGTVANTVTSGLDLTVDDVGNCPVDLSIDSAAAAPSTWAPGGAAGANTYLMKADASGASSSAPTLPASYPLTLATAPQALTSGLRSGGAAAFALYFTAPTSVTSGSAIQQTIVITVTAALPP